MPVRVKTIDTMDVARLHVNRVNPHIWALPVWLALASSASAQSFVGGGLLVSWQPDHSPYVGTQNPSVPAEGIHGVAAGGSATIGIFVRAHVGIAGEFSVPRRFEADQMADKYRTHNTHRDVVVSSVLHVRPGSGRIDGIIGVSCVREQTQQQIAHRLFAIPGFPYEPYSTPPEPIARTTFAVTGGVDLPLSLGRHVSMVPQFRVDWIAREDDSTAASPRFLGLSPIVLRPGIGVRMTF